MGDSADNVHGVAGCGPKEAAKLLADWGSLPAIVAVAKTGDGAITPALAKAIGRRQSGALERARKLVALRYDVLADDDIGAILEKREPKTETADEFKEDSMADGPETVPPAEPTAPSQPMPAPLDSGPGMTKALVPYTSNGAPTAWARGLEPRDMAEAKQLAKYVLDSRLFSAFGTPQAALLVIMSGRELGIGAMSSLQGRKRS